MERFMKLVKDNDGFEMVTAYRDEVDHYLGGKGDEYWYVISRDGKVKETYTGFYKDGSWKDTLTKGKGQKATVSEVEPGTTIGLIIREAYLAQDEKWVKDREGKPVEDAHPHLHYVYGFGDKAADISKEYGVTTAYSDLKNEEAGFHLRYICTGKDVDKVSS